MNHEVTWLTLAALGAYHGLNPAMGWLFAVSQGLQHRERRAVLRSLVPIAIGHELSILLVFGAVLLAGDAFGNGPLHVGAAAVLFGFGIFRFWKPRAHFRWTTMRPTQRELGWWSFLMASAHGAGLMIAPVVIGAGIGTASAHDQVHVTGMTPSSVASNLAGLGIHVAVMLVVMGVIGVVVYDHAGLDVLGRAWINTDRFWAAAFVFAAIMTLLF